MLPNEKGVLTDPDSGGVRPNPAGTEDDKVAAIDVLLTEGVLGEGGEGISLRG
jgi:hypothetical protein